MAIRRYDTATPACKYNFADDGGAVGDIDLNLGIRNNNNFFFVLGVTTVNFASAGAATIQLILFTSGTIIGPAIPFAAMITGTPLLFNFPITTPVSDTVGLRIAGAPLTAGAAIFQLFSTFTEPGE